MSIHPRRAAAITATALLLAALNEPNALAADLTIHGSTAPNGDVWITLSGAPGDPALLFASAGFLTPPAPTTAGAFYLDLAAPWFLLPFGTLPATGSFTLAGKLPNDPSLLGVMLHMQGHAGAFTRPSAMLIHPPATTIAPFVAGLRFGELVVGGDFDSDGGADFAVTGGLGTGTGQVRLFHGITAQPGAILTDPTPQPGGRFGASLVSADITGDGITDLVISAAGAGPTSADDTGEVWILPGPSLQAPTLFTSPTPQAGSGFGVALGAGDFDGDGFLDLAVGAPGSTVNSLSLAGEVQVFSGPALTPIAVLSDAQPGSEALFGGVLAVADQDQDGFDDLLVGAPGASVSGIPYAGKAFLHRGPLSATAVAFHSPDPVPGGAFGCRLAFADFGGSATLDVVSGAPGCSGSAAGNPSSVLKVGEVDIFTDGDPALARVIDDPTPEFFQHFGMDVSTADVNGDGAADLLVGAFLANSPLGTDAGEVFAFLGPSLAVRIDISAPKPVAFSQFGVFLAGVDLDQDGDDELVVGAPFDNTGGFSAGRAFVIPLY